MIISHRKETETMKTAKLILGILSIILSIIVLLQSCAVGVGNALSDSEEVSGQAGVIVAIVMLAAGIIGITTRQSRGGGITTGIFYLLAALIGFANVGTYSDLGLWSALCLIFGIIFLIGSFTMKKKNAVNVQPQGYPQAQVYPQQPQPQAFQNPSPVPQQPQMNPNPVPQQPQMNPNPQQRVNPNPQQRVNPNPVQNPQNRPQQY